MYTHCTNTNRLPEMASSSQYIKVKLQTHTPLSCNASSTVGATHGRYTSGGMGLPAMSSESNLMAECGSFSARIYL